MLKLFLQNLYFILKRLYIRFFKIVQVLNWYIQYFRAKRIGLCPTRLKKLNIDDCEKISILVPHADDEWIGTYSILNMRLKHLYCVYFNLYGGNEGTDNKLVRNMEIKASSEYWNFKIINNYNFDVEGLCEILNNSSKCFIPSPYDWHDEHREVFKTFVKAYNLLNEERKSKLSVFYFCVSLPHSYKEDLCYIALSRKNVHDMWNLFPQIYYSQSFMPALRYKLQLRLVPPEIGYAAQTFVEANGNAIINDYNFINTLNSIEKLSKLRNYINNIVDVRKKIAQIKMK